MGRLLARQRRRQEADERDRKQYTDGMKRKVIFWAPLYLACLVGGGVLLAFAFSPSNDANGCERCGRGTCAQHGPFAPQGKEGYGFMLGGGLVLLVMPSAFYCVFVSLWLDCGSGRRARAQRHRAALAAIRS